MSATTKYRILSNQQLAKLKDHKYASSGNTLLDPYMQIFWKWLVEQIPLTWAPNAITLLGLIGNILSTIFLMLYCPNGYGYAPPCCYLLCAVCLFIYQSLDAIDGKQARRTNCSTPLGELFDHGCDAFSIGVIIIGVCIASQIGSHPIIFSLVFFITTTLFYVAQWRTLVTGVMHFSILDVTEGQLAIISLYLVNAIFGHTYWDFHLYMESLSPKLILWLVGIIFGAYVFFNFMSVIVEEIVRKVDDLDGQGEGDVAPQSTSSTSIPPPALAEQCQQVTRNIQISKKVSPAYPLIMYVMFGMACTFFSKSHIMHNNVVLYHFMFGIVSTKLCCKILVSHMTKSKMGWIDSIFISPFILFVIQVSQVADEHLTLWFTFILAALNLLVYVHRVCADICDHLNIRCFSITPYNVTNGNKKL